MPIRETDADDGINDDKPFSPMYPVYNFNGLTPVPAALAPVSNTQQLPPSYTALPTQQQFEYGYTDKKSF